MGDTSGTGQTLLHLGVLERYDQDVLGCIGGRGQPSTLLIRFRVDHPFLVTVIKQRQQPFTDRFLAVGLRGEGDAIIPLDELGRPVGGDRLPPGDYAVSVSTSQWQEAPFRFRFTLAAQLPLQCALSGAGELVGGIPILRLQSAMAGRGRIRLLVRQRVALQSTQRSSGRMRVGLTAVPSYEAPIPAGLPHAWYVENAAELAVGSGDGLNWIAVSNPVIEGYVESGLGLSDFRAGNQRLIFSARSPAVYAAYTDLLPTPADVTAPACIEAPSVSFQSVVQGAYKRSCTFSLPVNGAVQIVIFLREELRWNNDIIRDVDTSIPADIRYSATTARSVSAHQRTLRGFVVAGTSIRQLRQLPGMFLSRVAQVLPPLSSTLSIRRLTVPGDRYPQARADCLVPNFMFTGGVPTEADQIFQLDPYGGLLLSFGMSWSMQARRGFSSAAVYDFLRDYASILGEEDYDRRSYSFVNRVLASRPAGLPQYSPFLSDGGYLVDGTAQGGYNAAGVGLLRYGRWSGDFPASASTQLDLSGPRWSLTNFEQQLREARLRRGQPLQLLVAYDWEQPAFCRTRLGELGFSSADLLPRETGWRYLLLLNPDGPGALTGQGSLSGSRVISLRVVRLNGTFAGRGNLANLVIRRGSGDALKGQGRLNMQLRIVANAPFTALYGTMRGAGRLPGGYLLPKPLTRLTTRGGLGRPVIFSGKVRLLQGAQAGNGYLSGGVFASGERDPWFANTSLLLPMNGIPGSVAFVDYSQNALTVSTVRGNVSLSSTQARFGVTSAYFDGSGDSLFYNDNALFGLGTGNFTLEFWHYYQGGNGYVCMLAIAPPSGNYVFYGLNTGNKNPFIWNNGNVLTTATAVTNNTWQHHAIVRNAGTVAIYLQGVQIGATSWNVNLGSTGYLSLGANGGNTQNTKGFMADIRITKAARYATNFTPRTTPFPTA